MIKEKVMNLENLCEKLMNNLFSSISIEKLQKGGTRRNGL